MSMSTVLLIFGVAMAAIVYMQCDSNNPFTLHRRSTKDLVEEVLADPILIVLHAYHTSDEQLKLGYGQLCEQLGSLRELNRRKDVCHCIHLVMRELRERCEDAQTKQEVLEMQYRQTIGELLLEVLAD